jgi:hypothetical protein
MAGLENGAAKMTEHRIGRKGWQKLRRGRSIAQGRIVVWIAA